MMNQNKGQKIIELAKEMDVGLKKLHQKNVENEILSSEKKKANEQVSDLEDKLRELQIKYQ